ncbi:hypothetical protein THAOC_22088 [Thalassiosira oceanica]|uniref:Uncharacterized protein n=1 Tax=Thalassiosira oceanica TaxID=159749 RepID=K0SH18_THAOC|nr:hypothetical protein THAOC_22088 [Thalassiosira oceanica]|eukprot:EJK57832.1 hypothetical protein THAOC_22088 [Thalassiosira oceanica]
MEPSRCSRADEGRKRKLDASNNEGSLVASDAMDFKALLDQHSEQMRRMQSQIDGLVAINSALQARLDGQAGSQAQEVFKLKQKCGVLESRRIKDDVETIRNGGEGYCNCLDYYGHSIILHNDALLSHFKELAGAIQLSNKIQRIDIDNIELHPSALEILYPAMEGRMTKIDMRRIIFPGPNVVKCYKIIASSIRRNHALETLKWYSNRIPSDEHADLLIKSIIDNWSIENVLLANCFNQSGANGCRALAALMASGRSFQELDFSENSLWGVDDVATALATNPQLDRLWICGNELNDRDAELIAQALKQNTNLQELNLGDSNMTRTGFEKIGASNLRSFKPECNGILQPYLLG